MKIVTIVCALILAATACGSVKSSPDAALTPDAVARCVLGSAKIGQCRLGQ